MSSSDAINETFDGGGGIADRLGSLAETVGPAVVRQVESGNLAAASGVVSLLRAGRSFLHGDRKRGVLRLLGGLFWVGVALAQRRSGGGGTSPSADELSDVAGTSTDVEEAVDPGGRETDHATGEDVVDTTDADIEESDTAPEVESTSDVESDATVDQREVTETTDVEDVADAGEANAAEDADEIAEEVGEISEDVEETPDADDDTAASEESAEGDDREPGRA